MSEWIPISKALSNMSVMVRTSNGHVFPATWRDYTGFGGQWGADNEGDHPASWTDGLCWSKNVDGKPSDPPVSYMVVKETSLK